MMLASDLAVLDHVDGSVTLIANAINRNGTVDGVEAAYQRAVGRLERMTADLAFPAATSAAAHSRPASSGVVQLGMSATPEKLAGRISSNRGGDDFRVAVETAKEQIRAGEAFQIVLSQRFELRTAASALDVYRVLRASNPSPYMYLFRFPTAMAPQAGQAGLRQRGAEEGRQADRTST